VLKVVTTEEMRRIEKAADAGGLSYDEMMTNAGEAIARAILEQWPGIKNSRVLILVGPGNNGGDGLVVGFHLSEAGADVELYLSHARSESKDHNYARIKEAGAMITLAEEDSEATRLYAALQEADFLVDALLGTGIKLPLRGVPKEILSTAKSIIGGMPNRPYLVAVDCPSGLDCDSGDVAEESLAADLTVTLAAVKTGLFEFPGAAFVGKLEVGPIGVPQELPEMAEVKHLLANAELVRAWLPERPLNAHKGTFGHVVVVAGSINFPGAAVLAGLGAYRSGAGLVTLAVPLVIQSFLVSALPEATWIALPHEMGSISRSAAPVLQNELAGVDAVLIGPGFGRDPETKSFLEMIFHAKNDERRKQLGFIGDEQESKAASIPPCVIDADGLKLLSEISDWYKLIEHTAVLTPHPGEFAYMTGLSISEVLANRTGYAREYSRKWGHVVVLKGAYTIVADPEGQVATVPIATPALATAGTGDVLAGVILGMRSQGLGAFQSAVVGAYLHAQAGAIAAAEIGSNASVIAGDVADFLPSAFAELNG
jgi:hydroxyethylthiazole kinase-like uncharacterized protein yjeF